VQFLAVRSDGHITFAVISLGNVYLKINFMDARGIAFCFLEPQFVPQCVASRLWKKQPSLPS
jgi:hypothetical protein